jgi:hypothetical protein
VLRVLRSRGHGVLGAWRARGGQQITTCNVREGSPPTATCAAQAPSVDTVQSRSTPVNQGHLFVQLWRQSTQGSSVRWADRTQRVKGFQPDLQCPWPKGAVCLLESTWAPSHDASGSQSATQQVCFETHRRTSFSENYRKAQINCYDNFPIILEPEQQFAQAANQACDLVNSAILARTISWTTRQNLPLLYCSRKLFKKSLLL